MGESKRRKNHDPDFGRALKLEIIPVSMSELAKYATDVSEAQMLMRWHLEGFVLVVLKGQYEGTERLVSFVGTANQVANTRFLERYFIGEIKAGKDFDSYAQIGWDYFRAVL